MLTVTIDDDDRVNSIFLCQIQETKKKKPMSRREKKRVGPLSIIIF
jgi:hypothetical protein